MNHRAFQERLRREVRRAHSENTQLGLVLFDIDHFRRVNDLHGHMVGDMVLTEFGRRLSGIAASTEVVARIGGEEFAWLIPGADGSSAWDAAERARAVLVGSPFPDIGTLTASAGVCSLAQAEDADELMRFASGALYWAKGRGRNATYLYSPDVVEVLSAEERANRLTRFQAMQSIRVLARAVDAKDHSTREHSERVADLAVQIAVALGWSMERAAQLREAGLLHDVGKIGIPDAILLKTGPLSPKEYELVKSHSAIGAQIAAEVLTDEQVAWIRGHHERWDGGGYPDGMAGEAVPDGARILAVADAWDVMTSLRAYREAWDMERALEECREQSGRQFCPDAVAALDALCEAGALLAIDEAGRSHIPAALVEPSAS